MRRSVLLLGAVVSVALVLGAGAVALAATIECSAGTPCVGTRRGDALNGSPRADYQMSGRAGADDLRGRGGSDRMAGGLGADKVSAGNGDDNQVVWGGEQRGNSSPYTYPDKSNDRTSGGRGRDRVYGGFGRGGVDAVFGNGGNDTIVVAQRGFPSTTGKVKVTKEVVDCGTGNDTVYRDRKVDVIADDCEHKIAGFPETLGAARGDSPLTTGPPGAVSSTRH
jgi:Ca2+-binding RTX toxin-like protein